LSRAAWFALGSGAVTAAGACAAKSDFSTPRVISDASVVGDDACSPYDYSCQPMPLYGSPPSPPEPSLAEDASVCGPREDMAPILASTFGQTCDAAADCVAVGVGDPCYVCAIRCRANAAIRAAALADWQTAMDRTLAASAKVSCHCAPPPVACCNAGICSLSCGFMGDAAAEDAGVDAGTSDAGVEAPATADAAVDHASSDAEAGAD
jgi:hypothetical protein